MHIRGFYCWGNRNLVRLGASKLRLGASEGALCIYEVFTAGGIETYTPTMCPMPYCPIPQLCVQCPIVLRLRVRLSMCEVFTISGNRNLYPNYVSNALLSCV